MFCPKCGSEIIDGRCNYCGYMQKINFEEYGSKNTTFYTPQEPANAGTVKILGILSIFIPILFIPALIMSKGYNKKNNYGGSKDMKTGKICAKVVLWLNIISLIASSIIFFAGVGTIMSNKEMYNDLSNALSEYETVVDDYNYNDEFDYGIDSDYYDESEENNITEDNNSNIIEENYIEKDEAIEIVLNDAGFTMEEVNNGHCDLEDSYKGMIYSISFTQEFMHYSYEIDAKTGDILNVESYSII